MPLKKPSIKHASSAIIFVCLAVFPAVFSCSAYGKASNQPHYVNMISLGADPTGASYSDAAINKAVQILHGQGELYFPPGEYKFNAPIKILIARPNTSISIIGSGQDVTTLTWPSPKGAGLMIEEHHQSDSFHIKDLSLTTRGQNKASAIYIVQNQPGGIPNPARSPESDIENVTIRGNDGYAKNDYWENGIYIDQASNINFFSLKIMGKGGAYSKGGAGIVLRGSKAYPAVQYNFDGSDLSFLNMGIVYGNYVQGVTVSQSNFTGDSYGILTFHKEHGLDQLAVSASQFNCRKAGIFTPSAIPNTLIMGNLFIDPESSIGIYLEHSGIFSIIGNSFNGGGSRAKNNRGIVIDHTQSPRPGIISGNLLLNQHGGGIMLKQAASHVSVGKNMFAANGRNIVDESRNAIQIQ